jgi:hypothetical protein
MTQITARPTAPIELRAEAIEAVRNKADLALSDRYLNHSGRVLPTLALAGALSLVGGAALGAVGVGLGILWCFQNDSKYRKLSQEIRSTKQFKPIAQALKDERQVNAARVIWQYKGDLSAYAWDQRYADLLEPGDVMEAEVVPSDPADGGLRRNIPVVWADGMHLCLIGLSGSSKSTTLVTAAAPIKDTIIYITQKLEDVPQSWESYRLGKLPNQAFADQLRWLIDRLAELITSGAPHRLIVDEALNIIDTTKAVDSKLGKEFQGLLQTYIRTGRSDDQLLALVSQSPNGTDLFKSAKTAQGLQSILCAGERSSQRFLRFCSWAQQLFPEDMNSDIQNTLGTIKTGFWHLYNDGQGLVLNETQLTDVALVPVQECPKDGQPTMPTDTSKAQEFLARYDNDNTAQFAAKGNPDAVKALAYCKLLKELMDAPDHTLKLSQMGSRSGFVSALFKGGVIEARARDEWMPILDAFAIKGYVGIDAEAGVVSLGQ